MNRLLLALAGLCLASLLNAQTLPPAITFVSPSEVNVGSSGALAFFGSQLRTPFSLCETDTARVVFRDGEQTVTEITIQLSQVSEAGNFISNVEYGPALTGQERDLTVRIEWGASFEPCEVTNSLSFTVRFIPELTSVVPDAVDVGSSGTLTFTGTNLRVLFDRCDTSTALAVFYESESPIAEIPIQLSQVSANGTSISNVLFNQTLTSEPGFMSVRIEWGEGEGFCDATNFLGFQVVQFPSVTSIVPNQVFVGSTGTATITGNNFIPDDFYTTVNVFFRLGQTVVHEVQVQPQSPTTITVPYNLAVTTTAGVYQVGVRFDQEFFDSFSARSATANPPRVRHAAAVREQDVGLEQTPIQSNTVPFTVVPVPVCPFNLLSINPSSAVAGSAGVNATIATNASPAQFTAQIRWTMNGVTTTIAATGSNARQISFLIPGALLTQPGIASISVVLNTSQCEAVTSSNSLGFEIIEIPELTGVSPSAAEVGRGDLNITINGRRFQSGDVLRWEFQGVRYSISTNFVSPTQMSATVPAARFTRTGVAFLAIERGNFATGALPFAILDRMRITSLNPASVPAGIGPFTLNVLGSGFDQRTRIRFGTTTILTVFVSSTELRVSIPGNLVAEPAVIPVTAVGLSPARESNTVEFLVERALRITTINPAAADEGTGPVALSITGAGFASGAQAFLGETGLSTQFGSATQLSATIPASALDQPATLQVTVRNPDGETSNAVPFTIRAVFRLDSLSPTSTIAGQPAFQLALGGRGFASGATATWNGTSLTTTFGSRTRLTANVPAALIANPGSATVAVVNADGSVSNALTFTIQSEPLTLSSVAPPSAPLGSPSVTVTLSGTGFRPGASALWNATTLASQFVSRTELTATISAELLAQPGSNDIRVRNPDGQIAGPVSFVVTVPLPGLNLTGLNPTPVPTQPTSVGVQLGAAAPVNMAGTLALQFAPNANAFPPPTENRQLAFAAGGKAVDFTIGLGEQNANIPNGGAIQQGTVAGTITVLLTRLVSGSSSLLPPGDQIVRTVQVPRLPPVIVPGSVRFVNPTASGFEIEFTAYSTPRDVTNAQFSFAGTNIEGDTAFTVQLGSAVAAFYDTEEGRANGSLFRARIPFTLSGGAITAIQSVTVRLTNSVGTSEPVTGTR
jgi:hypothetical protein